MAVNVLNVSGVAGSQISVSWVSTAAPSLDGVCDASSSSVCAWTVASNCARVQARMGDPIWAVWLVANSDKRTLRKR
jgi:hypothetical protein